MKHWLFLAALPLLGGCVSMADIGEDPLAVPRYPAGGYPGPAYPGWWGRDAVSIDIFLGTLGPWGVWQTYPGFGRVWVPHPVGAGWSPYWNGQWRNDPRYGRRWVSYDPFGFATDHYGQWQRHPSLGWFWVPGTRFQPGWSAPPPGWTPRPANWQPPAPVAPRPRPPVAGRTDNGPPVAGWPSGRPQDWQQGGPRPDREAGRPVDADPERQATRPDRPRGEGWQRRAPGAARPASAEVPADRPAPVARPARADRPQAPAPSSERSAPARAERPTVTRREPTESVQPY